MVRSVFGRALLTRVRPLAWWAFAVAALTLWVLAFYPIIQANPELEALMEAMPPEMLAIFAGGVAELVSPVGYLNSQLFATMVPLMLLIYAIGFGTQAVAGEEERGTIELVLSTPISRVRYVLEQFGAMVLMTAGLGFVFWLVLWLGDVPFELEVGGTLLAAATVGGVLLALAHGSLALAIGGATGRRALAGGLSAAVAVAGYLLYTMAPLSEDVEPLQVLSPFYYYLGAEPLAEGLDLAHAAGLAGATLLLLAVALIGFRRRDVRL